MSSNNNTFQQGPCGCCNMGCGACCMTTCCPCIAYYQAAENIGDTNSVVYLLGTLLGFGCCVLTVLGDKVAHRRGIEHGIPKSAVCSACDLFVCYSCAVVAEAQDIKDTADAPQADNMKR